MKLAYVCQYFTREYRGPVTNLMSELSRGADVVNYSYVGKHMQYYAGGEHSAELEKAGERLTLRRYDVSLKVGGLLFPKNLDVLLALEKPDIVQSEEYYQPASHVSYGFAKRNNIPFIFNHRGSEHRNRTLKERAFFALANPASRKLVEGSDAVVCLSEAGRDVLCGVFPKVREKIRIVPNSIDPQWYSGADGAAFRREHNIPESSPLLLCVARMHPQKRIDLLVRAFANVKRRYPEAVLCVVGPWFHAEKRKVDAKIAQLGLEDVILAGPVPNDKVKDAYAAADVVSLSSEFEPFGYCLLEAMCQAKPVVAFGIGAVPEIIEQGVCGYHVPFGDTGAFAEKVNLLLSDRHLASKVGWNGLLRVKSKFHIKENANKLLELYESLVK